MLKKDFVPYEESLALNKQLGFNEPCLAYWYNETPTNPEGQCLVYYKKPWDEQKIINGIIRDYYVAPTFSQAFRWFRENYDLFGVVEGKGYEHKRYYIYSINGKWHPSQPAIDTYEEAELACLKELIVLLKSQKS